MKPSELQSNINNIRQEIDDINRQIDELTHELNCKKTSCVEKEREAVQSFLNKFIDVFRNELVNEVGKIHNNYKVDSNIRAFLEDNVNYIKFCQIENEKNSKNQWFVPEFHYKIKFVFNLLPKNRLSHMTSCNYSLELDNNIDSDKLYKYDIYINGINIKLKEKPDNEQFMNGL